eukprot:6067053-Ditylum_brightwellii.AAC.1
MRILNAMGLQVKLPMTLYIDKKSVADFSNNWLIGGRTRHVKVKQYFLRELKEARIVEIKWKKGENMQSDIFIKNCDGATFERHLPKFVGVDKYMRHNTHKGRVPEAKDCEYHEGTYM